MYPTIEFEDIKSIEGVGLIKKKKKKKEVLRHLACWLHTITVQQVQFATGPMLPMDTDPGCYSTQSLHVVMGISNTFHLVTN